MSSDERDFRIRPGRIRDKRVPRQKSFINQVIRAAKKSGHVSHSGTSGRVSGYGRSSFGRGRTRFARTRLFSSSRRVVVKARVVCHKGRAFRSAPLTAHVAYLKREGVTRDGECGVMFDAACDSANDRAFAQRCEDDRHHFRFIVSPEDAADMQDLRDVIACRPTRDTVVERNNTIFDKAALRKGCRSPFRINDEQPRRAPNSANRWF